MPIGLRGDFDAACLRAVARKSKDGAQARRLLALAAIYDGAKRLEAAGIGGVTRQIDGPQHSSGATVAAPSQGPPKRGHQPHLRPTPGGVPRTRGHHD